MRCPYCGNPDTQVKDSRPSEDNTAIRRRRVCTDCGGRFTTFERVQLRELMVVKRNNRRVPFDRDKLMRSVQVALRKRQVDPDRVERMVNGIVRQLESTGRERGFVGADRASGDGGLARARRGGVRALRLGLQELQRGQGLRGVRRRARRRSGGPKQRGLNRNGSGEWLDRNRSAHDGAALRLGRRNLGSTKPNPAVGAIIVRTEAGRPVVVGRGWTAEGGRPHAETEALGEAGEAARGATAYVTLEPCAHHGGTPPCSEALVKAGVARVVYAIEDPDPRVSGRGRAILEAAGIAVTVGVLRDEAMLDHAGHIARVTKGRPHVILKLAVSADGMIGRREGERMMITSPPALTAVQAMRAEADAVAIGIGTVLVDDPRLTVRLPGLEKRSPLRVVLDATARLPLQSKLVATAREVPVVAVTGPEAPAERKEALGEAGVRIIAVGDGSGGVNLEAALRRARRGGDNAHPLRGRVAGGVVAGRRRPGRRGDPVPRAGGGRLRRCPGA